MKGSGVVIVAQELSDKQRLLEGQEAQGQSHC